MNKTCNPSIARIYVNNLLFRTIDDLQMTFNTLLICLDYYLVNNENY